MNVYIVAVGERGEGASPEAVFADRSGATKYAREAHGVELRRVARDRWMASSNGVDQVWILRMAVR